MSRARWRSDRSLGGAAQGLAQKVAAYVSGLKESEDAEKVVAELAREDNRARTPMEVAILQVCLV